MKGANTTIKLKSTTKTGKLAASYLWSKLATRTRTTVNSELGKKGELNKATGKKYVRRDWRFTLHPPLHKWLQDRKAPKKKKVIM